MLARGVTNGGSARFAQQRSLRGIFLKRLLLSTMLLAATIAADHPAIADEHHDNNKLTIAVFGDWPYTQILLTNAPLRRTD